MAESMNREDMPIGSGAEDGSLTATQSEVMPVSKQTTETLMAGERIMEALDLADNERATSREYEEAMAKLAQDDPLRLQPPPRNPILAANDLDPEAYVLRTVEKVQSAALHDALLVLPFGKIVSLMYYLTTWAQKVRGFLSVYFRKKGCGNTDPATLGPEYTACFSNHVLHLEGAPSSNRGKSHNEDGAHSLAQTPSSGVATSEGDYGLQSSCFTVHEKTK